MYIHAGYQVLFVQCDAPVTGLKLSSRSEDIFKSGGHAEIINSILNKLGLANSPQMLIGGYD